jgi:hypothetical protein
VRVLEFLKENGVKFDEVNSRGVTHLLQAAFYPESKIIQFLIGMFFNFVVSFFIFYFFFFCFFILKLVYLFLYFQRKWL